MKSSSPRPDNSNFVYQGKRISFKVTNISLPNGKIIRKEIVEHPGAVVILPFLDDKIVFLKQFRASINNWIYELPAGTLDKKGESLEECALRELKEETGYVADKATEMFRMYPSPGFSTEIIYSFFTDKLEKGTASPEETEIIQTIVLPFEEALELIRKEAIVDAKTIASLLYYDRYLRTLKGV
jgi:ADP-ribose pyrophosphatase